MEPIDGDFFAIGLINERPLRPEVGIAPLRAGVREFDLTCLGEGATDEGFDGGAQHVLTAFGGLRRREELGLGVGLQPLEQEAFEFRITGFRRGVGGIPDRQFFFGQRGVIALDDRFRLAEFEVLIKHGVEAHAGDCVIVMGKVFAALEGDEGFFTVELVKRLQVGESLDRHFLRPVIGRVHALGLGGEERGDFYVTGVNAEERGVLAGAAALHAGTDHHHRVGEGEAWVGRCEQHRLRAAAAGTRHRETSGIDFGERQQEVDTSDQVERLQTHHTLQIGFGLRAIEAPLLHRVHFKALLGELMNDGGRELDGVGIAERVDLPDDATHAGELDAHRLETGLAALFETFLTGGDFFADNSFRLDEEAGVGPMPVRKNHGGNAAVDVFRPIEVSGREKARGAFEIDFFDRVVALVDLTVDHRVQRRLGRHGPEPLGDEQLPANEIAAWFPFLDGFRGGEGEITVEAFQRSQTGVFGLGKV